MTSDQQQLAYIAINDNDFDKRKEAFNRLFDQELLAYVILETCSSRYINGIDILGDNAVKKLSDQRLLGYVAKNALNCYVRFEAVTELADRQALAEIAASDEDWNVRDLANKKLAELNK